jgi:1-acyl-sn-glycerol-3-phosphate acyltransferase
MSRSIPLPSGASWTRSLYERLAFAFALAVFGVGGLAYTAVGVPLRWLLPRRAGAAVGQWVMWMLFRFFVGLLQLLGLARCDLAALDALRGGPPLVIVPNHPTLLDALVIVSRLPNVACIMKAAVVDNVFLGGGARLAGYIRADSPKEMIRSAAEMLRAGRHVLVFPEGTRTVHPPVNRFTAGFAAIARLAGAPVQTVFVEAGSPYLRKGWPLLRRPEFPLVYRVRLGARFPPPADPRALVAELETYFRRELAGDPPR